MAVAWLLRPLIILFSSFVLLSPFASSVSDSEALLKLRGSFTNANALQSWAPGSSPCLGKVKWEGLICYNGIVVGLRLEGKGLTGKIDIDALIEMQGLRTISFMNNSFSGTIPQFNRLGALRAIYLSMNQFSGEIPPDYFAKAESLKKVWLSDNKFTGKIPSSLGQLPHLIELHLENNQFSGPIPNFNHPTLRSIDFSNNKLDGKIPPSLSQFNSTHFAGNSGLCGDSLGVDCNKGIEGSIGAPRNDFKGQIHHKDDTKKVLAAVITLGVMLLSVFIILLLRWRRKRKEDFDVLAKESTHSTAVEVQVAVPQKKEREATEQSLTRKNTGSGRRGSMHARGGGLAELVIVNDEKGVFGLPDLMKAAAEVLGNGGSGSSYKAVMNNGTAVVVKRMREMNALGRDAFDAEVKKLGRLRHPNILTPLAYHYRKDEKLIVYEYLPKGSLLYLLHGDRGPSHAELDWPTRLMIVQGIARGLGHLHAELASLDVPHGNLKSSNVLLGPDNQPLLSDYGFSPLVNNSGAQALFAYKTPEAIQYNRVSPKSDVYCLGIIILEILTGKFPSQYLSQGKGGTDVVQWVTSAISEGRQAELLDPEIASSRTSLGDMEQLLQIGAACTQSNPEQRLDMRDAIRKIEEIQLLEESQEARAMQVLPSLRDGYADALSQGSTPSLPEGYGERPTGTKETNCVQHL